MDFLNPMSTPSLQCLLFGLVLALVVPLARAATEAELRAAVIYNITRFVQWPPAAISNGRFEICTLGNNPAAEALATLQGKSLNELPVVIRAVRHDRDLAGCQMLYVATEEATRMAAVAETLANSHEATLTVSDAPSFLALGGMVQLVVVNDRQRFRINQELAEKAHLGINAKLLQLALPGID